MIVVGSRAIGGDGMGEVGRGRGMAEVVMMMNSGGGIDGGKHSLGVELVMYWKTKFFLIFLF